MTRACRVTIDCSAIIKNYDLACQLAAGSKNIAVIKANAYGHGAVQVAQALEPRVPAFAVACIEEAIELRQAGISKPVLLLEGPHTKDEIPLAAEEDFWLMISTPEQAELACNQKTSKTAHYWLKLDTGMHRLGIQAETLGRCHEQLANAGIAMNDVVLATHLSSADDLELKTTQRQLNEFKRLTQSLSNQTSIANSAGILGHAETHSDWNRPGIMLYGSSPISKPNKASGKLMPTMDFVTEVISVRDVKKGGSVGYSETWQAKKPSRIATLAVGYADGYPRSAKNGTPVFIKGQRAPIAGRVSMDMITVDVSDIPFVKPGDSAELWGKNLSVDEVAKNADTISYELFTKITKRPHRSYK